jgi:hypothetical protein
MVIMLANIRAGYLLIIISRCWKIIHYNLLQILSLEFQYFTSHFDSIVNKDFKKAIKVKSK